jgi:hypothetical protein
MIILPVLANMPMFANDPRFEMYKDGLWVGIFAPSLKQSTNTYRRMKSRLQCKTAKAVLSDPDFNLGFDTSNGQTVSLTNGSYATAISASDQSNIEGDSYKLIICEECQDISDFKIEKSISPMGSAYNACVIKIGTPSTCKGDFYNSIERNKTDYEKGDLKLKAHFEYDYKVGAKYNPKYAKYVQKQMYRLGEFSDAFQMSYALKWILSRGMFVDVNFLEKNNGLPEESRVNSSDLPCSVGIDVAKSSDDTVVSPVAVDWDNPVIVEEAINDYQEKESYEAYNTQLLDWLDIQGEDYDSQYYTIMDYLKNFNVKRIMIDATKEESFCDRFKANLPHIEVVACKFSSQFKSDMYKYLDSEIKTGRFKFPMDKATKQTREYQKFIQQFGELQKEWKGQLMVCAHPPVRNAHDDFCLSLKTEILTKRGFLKYNELKETDLVAKVINNKITYVKPNKIIFKKYSGVMYRYMSKDLCLEVTKNHKMLILNNRQNNKQQVYLAQELAHLKSKTLRSGYSIPVAPKQEKQDFKVSDNIIKLIGWVITEGWLNYDKKNNTYRYSISQSLKNSYEEIQTVVDSFGFEPYVYTRKDKVHYWTFHVSENSLFDDILKQGVHRIPRLWLNEFSQRQLKLLLDTLMQGDGTVNRKTYHTHSLGLAQDVQELAHKLGIKTSIKEQSRTYKGKPYVMYACYLMKDDFSRINKIQKYLYTGNVWCVNVNNGFIVTRCDNKIAVTGNCDSLGLAVYGTRKQVELVKIEVQNKNPIRQNIRATGNYKRKNRLTARRR